MVDVFIIRVARKIYEGIQYFGVKGPTKFPRIQWITSYDDSLCPDSLCPNARITHEWPFSKKLIVCQSLARVH